MAPNASCTALLLSLVLLACASAISEPETCHQDPRGGELGSSMLQVAGSGSGVTPKPATMDIRPDEAEQVLKVKVDAADTKDDVEKLCAGDLTRSAVSQEHCCKTYGKHCDEVENMCAEDLSKSAVSKEYCCEKYGKHCDSPVDRAMSEEAMCASDLKKSPISAEHCCEKFGKHCSFDCDAGFSKWQAGWSAAKQEYCCKKESRGCPPTPPPATTTAAVPQEAEPAADDGRTHQPSLRLELVMPFKLQELNSGQFGPAPKLLEALHVELCRVAQLPRTRVVMLDIRGGHMKMSLVGKNAGLLQTIEGGSSDLEDVAIDDTTIDFEIIDGEPPARDIFKLWLEQLRNADSKLRKGPFAELMADATLSEGITHSEPFDCDAGLDKAETGWSQEKKTFCCKNHAKGCVDEPFDCLDEAQPEDAWSGEKREYCCKRHGLACEAASAGEPAEKASCPRSAAVSLPALAVATLLAQ